MKNPRVCTKGVVHMGILLIRLVPNIIESARAKRVEVFRSLMLARKIYGESSCEPEGGTNLVSLSLRLISQYSVNLVGGNMKNKSNFGGITSSFLKDHLRGISSACPFWA